MIGVVIGTIAIVLVTIVIGMLVDRKAPVLPRPEDEPARPKLDTTHGPGEAPASALRVREEQLDKLRAAQRCTECRQVMRSDPDEIVRYNDADLRVLHFVCGGCAARRTLYVTVR